MLYIGRTWNIWYSNWIHGLRYVYNRWELAVEGLKTPSWPLTLCKIITNHQIIGRGMAVAGISLKSLIIFHRALLAVCLLCKLHRPTSQTWTGWTNDGPVCKSGASPSGTPGRTPTWPTFLPKIRTIRFTKHTFILLSLFSLANRIV